MAGKLAVVHDDPSTVSDELRVRFRYDLRHWILDQIVISLL